ncbi:hypothetical protein pdam_00017630 [Pocillopora damicornis]|uniref:Major facilitator superfamily (MFS) profile domain-containing protein n=1 Tax=Pocillopora damicornis TaxID=46731 RepID=A0A3M6U7B2_POCDA|nr:hypothetical protein pdam_00017630 [Pocillopora damicornis]
MALSADDVLEEVGSFGWFQIRLLILFNLLSALLFGWAVMVTGIITAEPPWKCVQNSSVCTFGGSFYSGDEHYDHRCNISRSEWEFEDEMTTVVTEGLMSEDREKQNEFSLVFDLVCGKSIYGTLALAAVFLGFFVGAIIIGPFTDKFGRKPTIFISGFVIAVFSLVSAFPKIFSLFVVFKIIVGLGVAYFITDWRTLTIVTAVPGLPALLGWFLTPESVRWLMVKGRTEDAKAIFRRMARVNKTSMPVGELQSPDDDDRLGDVCDLFSSRQMVKKTLLSWFVNALVYYGVFLSAPNIGGNFYLNFFLTSLIELPAIPAGVWAFNRFGRKKSIIASLILAAIGAFASARWLNRVHSLLPFAIMGANALLAGVLCLTLPETKNEPTLETVKREEEEMSQIPPAYV